MRTIKLLKIVCDNFKCFNHKEVEFSEKSAVKGANGVGKSTLYNSVLWVLFDKDMNGNSATDIRPHDENGVDIDNIDISVACTFDVDGREITIKKTQKQRWVKKRGSDEKKFEGNVNEFEINSIPKDLKDVKPYIAQHFCSEDVFLACTNAQSFFRLDTKKRRAKLMSLASDITNADVVATDNAFEPLSDMLADGTVDELIKRSVTARKRLEAQLLLIPARIDEQEKSKVDVDTAELELGRNILREKISEIEAKEADLSKQYEEYQKASDGILELQFAINDLKRKANEGLHNQRLELDKAIYIKNTDVEHFKKQITNIEKDIASGEDAIARNKSEIQKQADLWNTANKRVFDENSLVCAYCGQSYPMKKQEHLRAQFESHKAKELETIAEKGSALKEDIHIAQKEVESYRVELEKTRLKLDSHSKELEKLQSELSSLPTEVDISDTEEYKALAKQLAEKEAFLEKGNSAEETRNQLSAEKYDLQSQLEEINSQLAKAQRNVDIDTRIEELVAEQRETAQRVADEERTLDLLEQFNRKKMSMLTESVNQHFKMVKWKLFSEQLNGGYADVCYATVNGTNYERGLNDSDCLLANIDILSTFQRMNDVSLPLFLDRAESINDSRIPQTDGQLILLKVSEDKEMIVEEEI